MYILAVFPLLFAIVSAGYLAAPVVPAPVAHSAPVVAHAPPPAATSYQNLHHPVSHSVPIQVPVAAPVKVVAPAVVPVHAPYHG